MSKIVLRPKPWFFAALCGGNARFVSVLSVSVPEFLQECRHLALARHGCHMCRCKKGGRCQGEKHLTVVPECLKPGALKSSEHQVSNTLVHLGSFFMYYMCLRDHGSPSRKGEGGGQGKNKKMVAEVANPAWQ